MRENRCGVVNWSPMIVRIQSNSWFLINQIDHAHLAEELARQWKFSEWLDVVDEGLLATIRRHDDGWEDWDHRPELHTGLGRPVEFFELPGHSKLAIWRKSIHQIRDLGPLAEYLVAAHFSSLRRQSDELIDDETQEFLITLDQLCEHWLSNWNVMNPQAHSWRRAKSALAHLQWFDRLSLGICMTPEGQAFTGTMLSGNDFSMRCAGGGCRIVSPWPFTQDELELTVAGRAVPSKQYETTAELLAVANCQQSLTWKLVKEDL